jgi:hypothetical protein
VVPKIPGDKILDSSGGYTMLIISEVTISGSAVWTELQLIFLGEVKRAISISGMSPEMKSQCEKKASLGCIEIHILSVNRQKSKNR